MSNPDHSVTDETSTYNVFQQTHMMWLSKYFTLDINGKNRMWQFKLDLHISISVRNYSHSSTNGKFPQHPGSGSLAHHTYNRGALQQILQVTAMKIKRIALDMNESCSVTRPTGHMGILRCLCCFQGEVWWGGAVSPFGDVALPSQPARLC